MTSGFPDPRGPDVVKVLKGEPVMSRSFGLSLVVGSSS